ncbi:acyl-CoA dehydrogenase [Mycolicibacterium moriokaense]|uniref:Acyl-CoA dehydrogenase n=2 Tax=Mycolicibacterium moriokaense TaxID=39691 RepID=A0AAD1HFX3_9MYCO|nr:acyl-CoA dehydrogenase [Mycolicibacterium moriokaense]
MTILTSAVENFRAEARAWLAARLPPRPPRNRVSEPPVWGVGSDSVDVFPSVDPVAEAEKTMAAAAWQTTKYDAGYGAIAWETEYGGRGLSAEFDRAFRKEEAAFETPETSEILAVTLGLVAPTIRMHGDDHLRRSMIPSLLRAEVLACQLFSEPGAGSDLASLTSHAVRDGDSWIINGQKVWTSGARVCQYGEAICRTDRSLPKHDGLTVFLVPLDTPGVEIRPIRQMTGGSSFNEVFFNDVRVPDRLRIGEVGEGWRVALTTLGYERSTSQHTSPGGSFRRLLELARHLEVTNDPLVRQNLMKAFTYNRVLHYTNQRIAAGSKAGAAPGPEGSIRKLAWVRSLTYTGEAAMRILGARIAADTGEWGTYAWSQHILGAPGYHIAGGSDEIQRNIIAERVLKLPADPRVGAARNAPG